MPRKDVKTVVCSMCATEQPVGRECITCGVTLGAYFCEKCVFYDDEDNDEERDLRCSYFGDVDAHEKVLAGAVSSFNAAA